MGGWGGRLSILMSFERYRTILPGFPSRAMVNSRNVKMRGGLRSIPLVVVVFFNSIKCIFSGLLSISKLGSSSFIFKTHFI